MKTQLLAGLTCVLIVSGCATVRESAINPFNWFGRSEESTADIAPATLVLPLVAEVTAMRIDKAPGGAIIHATGLPPTQGYWEAELDPDANADTGADTLVINFSAFPHPQPQPVGTPRSRELSAALFLSDQALAGVRTVIVRGRNSQRSARR